MGFKNNSHTLALFFSSEFSRTKDEFSDTLPSGRIDALKIPARRAEYSLTESALSPFHAEPTHTCNDQFIAYPAAFHASTPPFSALTLVKSCASYFAA